MPKMSKLPKMPKINAFYLFNKIIPEGYFGFVKLTTKKWSDPSQF